ncbi:MAG TPA: ADP-ribosylglycohydrolase family protein [Kofleriaceae bacterium]|nr:ADP-ribosylglycohydrolase family protein [Kofleriaceae bacterium]
MANAAALARARQSLIGLSVGDAFGETMFGEPREVAKRAAKRLISTRRPWRWTDDTAMALSIVEVLARFDAIDPDALAEAFARRWSEDPNRGYGQGAFNLLTRVSHGAPWRREAQRLFNGQGSYGNGAAMRAAPIGAYFAGDLDRVRTEALRSAEPTHVHPDGAAGAVAVALAAALAASGVERTKLLEQVIRFTPPGHTLDRLRRAAEIDLDAAPAEVGEELGTGLDVAAHDTVPFCLWVVARHLDSYEDAIWTATSQHGDRDTMGAIVGGVLVLATSEDQIPVLWRAAMEPVPDPLASTRFDRQREP